MTENSCTVSNIIDVLGDKMDFSAPNCSFSPHYSDIGLGFERNRSGIAHLFMHYNRRTTQLGAPFLALPEQPFESRQTAISVWQNFGTATAAFAFYRRNSWLMECSGLDMAVFDLSKEAVFVDIWRSITARGSVVFQGYMPNGDQRDPDTFFPFIIGLNVLCGHLAGGDGITVPMVIQPNENGHILVAFSVNMLDVDVEKIEHNLMAAPPNVKEAERLTRQWFKKALGDLSYHADDVEEAKALAQAVYTLISNASEAPGFLAGRIAAFPSRGGYPTHFLWDACFQNLALEYMEPRLAEDSLLLLIDNLRQDGKMPHFICSTWIRPHESQPPLVGWAGLRLVKLRKDKELAAKLLPALAKNTQWWLTQRMSRYGIIACYNPLETGWDDTPRLDQGPTLACDMNSYVLMQMRACAELADFIGDDKAAAQYRNEADAYAQKMVEMLYDPNDNLFKDVLVSTGQKLPIKTPACFLPLLAGVPIDEAKAHKMIKQYLLDPDCFFGAVPFPSVAYNEPTYKPDKWWRGPTWMPVAYLMLDILLKYGYIQEYYEAAWRLYRVMLKDGNMRELFNSDTGEGLGNYQQGWTAAIFLRLNMELAGNRK